MLAHALALSSLVIAQAGAPLADAEVAYMPSGDVYCDAVAASFDPATVYATQDAPPGGVFWLPLLPSDGTAARIFFSAAGPSLRTGGGEELVPDVVRETLAAVAIAVPDGAEVGATFLLHPANSTAPEDTLILRVVEPALETPSASVVVGAPVANPFCYADCYTGEQLVPRAASVDIVVEGGPVIVDAWQTVVGGIPSALEARLVDTRLVLPTAAGDDVVTTTLQVGTDYLEGEVSMTLVVEVRNAADATLLSSSTLVIDALPNAYWSPPEEQRWECTDGEYYDDGTYDGGYVCACADVTSTPNLTLLLPVALLVAFRRRR
jgi:hypothetical protein